MLQRWFQETQTNLWDQKRKKRDLDDFENSFEKVPYQLWSVNKYGACADAAITGVMPPPLMELEVFAMSGSHWILIWLLSDLWLFLIFISFISPLVQLLQLISLFYSCK